MTTNDCAAASAVGADMLAPATAATARACVSVPEDCLADVGITGILSRIALVESGGADIGVHVDRTSWGRYGVTLAAAEELHDVGDVSRHEIVMLRRHPHELARPERNARLAYLYLRHMYDVHGCTSWIEAAGWYHGGDAERRAAYVRRLRNAQQ